MIKKIFAGIIASAFAISAFAATLNSIQLLNPVGSTSGQAIVSTGASTAPAWGNITASTLAAQAANTVVANVTGSSASPTAFAMPSCSSAGGTLQWTSGTGFTCLANAFASPPSTGYGSSTPEPVAATTISATGLITPTSTIGIKATGTNDNPQPGSMGEYAKGSATATSLTNNIGASCATLSLTPGDWDVTGIFQTSPAGTTTTSNINVGISTSSTTFITVATGINNIVAFPLNIAAGVAVSLSLPSTRITIASTTSVFVVAQVAFATSTMTCNGFLQARRAPH